MGPSGGAGFPALAVGLPDAIAAPGARRRAADARYGDPSPHSCGPRDSRVHQVRPICAPPRRSAPWGEALTPPCSVRLRGSEGINAPRQNWRHGGSFALPNLHVVVQVLETRIVGQRRRCSAGACLDGPAIVDAPAFAGLVPAHRGVHRASRRRPHRQHHRRVLSAQPLEERGTTPLPEVARARSSWREVGPPRSGGRLRQPTG